MLSSFKVWLFLERVDFINTWRNFFSGVDIAVTGCRIIRCHTQYRQGTGLCLFYTIEQIFLKAFYRGDTVICRQNDMTMEQLKAIKPDIYCVGECWSGDTEVLEYYGAMNCFNFAMAQAEGVVATAAKGKNIANYLNYIQSHQASVIERIPTA